MKPASLRQSLLSVEADISGKGRISAVKVPFADIDEAAGYATIHLSLEDRTVDEIGSADTADNAIEFVAEMIDCAAQSFLTRRGVAFERGHLRHLAGLGAVTIIESVLGPEWVPVETVNKVEDLPGLASLAMGLESASGWFGPGLANRVLTRAYEEACNLCHNSTPSNPQWEAECTLYTLRFFQFVHSAVFWPRFSHWSSVTAPPDVLRQVTAIVDELGQAGPDALAQSMMQTSGIVSGVTKEWGLPHGDPGVQGAEFLAIYLTALLQARDLPGAADKRRVMFRSDDLIRLRESIAITYVT